MEISRFQRKSAVSNSSTSIAVSINIKEAFKIH
jgi:hypothetical protein